MSKTNPDKAKPWLAWTEESSLQLEENTLDWLEDGSELLDVMMQALWPTIEQLVESVVEDSSKLPELLIGEARTLREAENALLRLRACYVSAHAFATESPLAFRLSEALSHLNGLAHASMTCPDSTSLDLSSAVRTVEHVWALLLELRDGNMP